MTRTDGRSLLPVAEAQARVLALAAPLAEEQVPLGAAAGRWLAEPLVARRSQPAHDLSSMDGYAIRHADLPGPWQVIGESAAGRPFAGAVATGEAVRIFTGAAVPAGADTVLVQEEAARDGAVLRLVGEGPRGHGGNVRNRGMDFTAGDTLLPAGAPIGAAAVALAAIAAHAVLPVRRRVRVAIAATGDELVPPGTAGDAQPESNSVLLTAMLRDLPVEVIPLGILPDDLDRLSDAFARVEADVLVTTGGASVGDHDLVRPALAAAGGTVDFWRIAMRPGKPMMAGALGSTVVLGLPGNPVSAFVTATLFLLPLVRHLSGATDPLPASRRAVLGRALPANDHRQDYLRGRQEDGRVFGVDRQDSSMLRRLAKADCLIVRPPHAPAAAPDDSVEILALA